MDITGGTGMVPGVDIAQVTGPDNEIPIGMYITTGTMVYGKVRTGVPEQTM
jgi:hypothetical protein